MSKAKKTLLIIIMLLLAIILIFSAISLISKIIEYNEANSLYEDIQGKYVATISPETTEPNTVSSDNTSDESKSNHLSPPIAVDFSKLIAENSDVVGWIYSENTPINYPVVQADNNRKYLHSDLSGNYLINGTIFVDCRNREIGKDLNYIIYGHSMNNQSMFGSLLNYKEQSYYNSHPFIYYLTEDTNYRIDLIAGHVVSTDEIIYQTSPDKEAFESYIDKACMRSTFKSNIEYESGDNIVTLSTCSYEYDDARYVVIGKLVAI